MFTDFNENSIINNYNKNVTLKQGKNRNMEALVASQLSLNEEGTITQCCLNIITGPWARHIALKSLPT